MGLILAKKVSGGEGNLVRGYSYARLTVRGLWRVVADIAPRSAGGSPRRVEEATTFSSLRGETRSSGPSVTPTWPV